MQSLDGVLYSLHLGNNSRHRNHNFDHALLQPSVDARRNCLQLGRHGRQVRVKADEEREFAEDTKMLELAA